MHLYSLACRAVSLRRWDDSGTGESLASIDEAAGWEAYKVAQNSFSTYILMGYYSHSIT